MGAVVVTLAALIVAKVSTGASQPKSGQVAQTATSSVASRVSSVPASTLDAIGKGSASALPTLASGSPLTAAGKPEVLYIGAEYCPYCAAERWAVAVALSRFGTFTGLGQTTSSPSDVYPDTATLTFHGATYASRYLTLTARETQSNQVVNGRYVPLDSLSPAEHQLQQSLDPSGGIPFVDFGGRYVMSGASYNPEVLQGKTHEEIAGALSDPASPVAKAIDGAANIITAALCTLTNGQPGTVCTSTGVTAAAATLPASHAG